MSIGRLLCAALVAAGALFAGAGLARAEGDLDVSADLDYRLDPDAGVVRVNTHLRLENTKGDQQVSGGVQYFYFTGYSFPVPNQATNVTVATADGTPLQFELQPIDDNAEYMRLDISFARNLRFGQVFDVMIDYDFVGAPPRDPGDLYRTNPAVMSFSVTPWGDPGQSTVKVHVPSGYAVTTFGDGLSLTNDGDASIYSAEAIDQPREFFTTVIAQDDSRLATTPLAVGEAMFQLRSWPGDQAWVDFATSQITRGLPVLEDLTGQKWPNSQSFEVMESIDPALVGYAGWYDELQQRIEVGEDLDEQTVLHELSHAWFNSNMLLDRWLSEGLAETYAELAVGQLGGTPDEPVGVAHGDRGYLRLADWDVPTGTEDEIRDTETYGYAASRLVVSTIAQEIGVEKLAAVLAAMHAGSTTYLAGGEPIALGTHVDWRRFLDLAEDLGGSVAVDSLYREWVVRDADLPLLDTRAAARAEYRELGVRVPEWAAPEGVARAMAAWNFTGATERMDAAAEALDARESAQSVLSPLGLQLPTSIEQGYESAVTSDDLADVTADLRQYEQVGDVLTGSQAAASAPRSFVERIGLRGAHPQADADDAIAAFERGDLDAAMGAAKRAVARWDDAERIGKERLVKAGVGAGGGVLLLTGAGFGVRRGRRRRLAGATTEPAGVQQATFPPPTVGAAVPGPPPDPGEAPRSPGG